MRAVELFFDLVSVVARPAIVNGAAGAIVGSRERPFAVAGFTVTGGRIAAIDLILDPDKLKALQS